MRNGKYQHGNSKHDHSHLEDHILCEELNTKWLFVFECVVHITVGEEILVDLDVVGGEIGDEGFDTLLKLKKRVI